MRQADIIYICNSIKYFIRILNSDEDTLLNKAYQECLKVNGESFWLGKLQELFKKIGVFVHRDCNIEYVMKIVKNFLLSKFIEYWEKELFNDNDKENGNKLRSYRTYKYNFKKKEYLSQMSKEQRCCFSRLRLSAHKLHIETGRYLNKKDRLEPNMRICKFCEKNACEDEFHFIMECNLYQELRKNMINNIRTKFPFFENYSKKSQFTWLMSNLDSYVLSILINYVQLAFKKRNETEVS